MSVSCSPLRFMRLLWLGRGIVTWEAWEKPSAMRRVVCFPFFIFLRASGHLISDMRQVWRKFEKKAKQSRTVKDVMKETMWFSAQLKPTATSRAWAGSGRSKDWEDDCRKCKGLRECKFIQPCASAALLCMLSQSGLRACGYLDALWM